ncbi:MAG TPA: AmmeMemoRadiSam system protein A [Candidatus Avalokitesvara rifleensis]|uniref:AmmeMemoRadiSam system protein A n=1 Tax=Candidatus Avalokitesvara rifleensis TaxID=3367620 RepID=UPI002713ECF2|nr:AmmeMemoRadiSam system protein A [Candidatus Brocadiales bacterium]
MNAVVTDEEEIQRETSIHEKLLGIARQSVEAAVRGSPMPDFAVTDPELCHRHGAFVTIKRHGTLRGCIGRFVSDIPLYQLVKEVAVSAATEDPRFRYEHLCEAELGEIDIEVSVISSLKKISNPLNFQLGRHGIYIKRGDNVGCLLPQVAHEKGWSKEEFLSYCCLGKAGLGPNAWKEADTEVYVFTAGIVSEHN